MTVSTAPSPASSTDRAEASSLPGLREQRALKPEGFRLHSFRRDYRIEAPRQAVWDWLNDPDTFVRGQPWPFRVEFVGGGFEDGVVCNHHGPLMNLPGVIQGLEAPHARDLHYLYGSYALSPRWIRPTTLRFELRETDSGCATEVTLRLEAWVRPWIAGLWNLAQRLFWSGFGWTARRGAARRALA